MKIIEMLNDKNIRKKINDIHNEIYNLMHKILFMFDKYNIKYTIAHGTLMGQVRNNNLLLWDDDIDFIIDNDKIIDTKKFKEDCYNIGLSIIITPYNQGYSAKYRITDHKFLNTIPSIEPILGDSHFTFPKIMADIHDSQYYRVHYPRWSPDENKWKRIDITNAKLTTLGPLNIYIPNEPLYVLKTFIKFNDINDVVITHLHSNGISNFFSDYINKSKLPYTLHKKEIKAIHDFYKSSDYTIIIKKINVQ